MIYEVCNILSQIWGASDQILFKFYLFWRFVFAWCWSNG